jgi:uncharacterized protein DUF4349
MRAIVFALVVASGCGGGGSNWESGYDAGTVAPAFEATQPGGVQTPSVESGLPRKIVHTANISLAVEDFGPIPERVAALATQFNGYVARSNVTGSPRQPRRGTWTIRVPADRFQELLVVARELGEPRSIASDSQDVSEEYYDVQSRISNKKNTETRLLVLLKEATGNLEQVLAVEEKLDRVREEIERMEGRVRVLDDLTAMTTVNLTVDEIKDFAPKESATYGTRIHRAFGTSVNNLCQTAQDLSVAVVYLLPWLAALLVVALVFAAALFLVLKVLRRPKQVVRATAVSDTD